MNTGEILIYQNQEGTIKIDVRLEEETVWLTQDQMGLLFGKAKSTINEHILNVYTENELVEETSIRKIGISDFSTKPTNHYNLDVVISVGYRVKSVQGTQFRIWATQRLKEYIVKGFTFEKIITEFLILILISRTTKLFCKHLQLKNFCRFLEFYIFQTIRLMKIVCW